MNVNPYSIVELYKKIKMKPGKVLDVLVLGGKC